MHNKKAFYEFQFIIEEPFPLHICNKALHIGRGQKLIRGIPLPALLFSRKSLPYLIIFFTFPLFRPSAYFLSPLCSSNLCAGALSPLVYPWYIQLKQLSGRSVNEFRHLEQHISNNCSQDIHSDIVCLRIASCSDILDGFNKKAAQKGQYRTEQKAAPASEKHRKKQAERDKEQYIFQYIGISPYTVAQSVKQ